MAKKAKTATNTPLMRQYLEVKNKYADSRGVFSRSAVSREEEVPPVTLPALWEGERSRTYGL